MLIRLGSLRRILREISAAGGRWPGAAAGRNVLSPDVNSREAIGTLAGSTPMDTVQDEEDGLPDHLIHFDDDEYDEGPVPRTAEEPGVHQDPFVRDSSPLPSPGIHR